MESISGLPAHPLFVHAPVVLIPLATLLALAVAFVPRLRRQYGWGLVVMALLALVTTQLAISSGGAFDELLDGAADTDEHEQLALMTRNFVVVFLLAATGSAGLERWSRGDTSKWTERAIWALTAVATLSAVMACVWVLMTGEEGARLVWDGVLTARIH